MAEPKQPFDRRMMSWIHGGLARIPVRVRDDGTLELRQGGPLPKIQDGAIGTLEVPEYSITDDELVDRIQQKIVREFIPSGSEVMFAINGDHTPDKFKQHLLEGKNFGISTPHLVMIELQAPLNLRMRGTNRGKLSPVNCWIPALNTNAKSLNHAYRLVSEKFEPKRISHAGNVFEIGYLEKEERWISLEDHRCSIEFEFGVFRDASSGA